VWSGADLSFYYERVTGIEPALSACDLRVHDLRHSGQNLAERHHAKADLSWFW
jgi:hypothetical protein